MFFSYFTHNPILNEMENYLYVEIVNQSLLATILRLTAFDFSASPFVQPLFLGLGMMITVVSAFLTLSSAV
ncbi:MAG: hypothetical protein GY796_06095 [Chloroflexi bacterium]|nr:hypothetical protein [Chloroflexota bacterium]